MRLAGLESLLGRDPLGDVPCGHCKAAFARKRGDRHASHERRAVLACPQALSVIASAFAGSPQAQVECIGFAFLQVQDRGRATERLLAIPSMYMLSAPTPACNAPIRVEHDERGVRHGVYEKLGSPTCGDWPIHVET